MSEPFAFGRPNNWLDMPEADISAIGGYFDIQIEGADVMASNINAAVTARERKAAAKALREAADSAVQDAEWKGVTEKTYTSHQMAQWLRTLADLAEKGER